MGLNMTYTTREKIRAQGFDESTYPNDMVDEAILITDSCIEKVCGQWFESREKTLYFDGDGTNLLVLDKPLISLSSIALRFLGMDFTPYDSSYFAVYADPDYSRIKALSTFGFGYPSAFPKGPQSVKLVGTWGYLEDGATPLLIQRAALELAPIYLGTLVTGEPQERLKKLVFYEEETDEHRYKIAEKMVNGLLTGIPSVDRVLARYKRKGTVSHG